MDSPHTGGVNCAEVAASSQGPAERQSAPRRGRLRGLLVGAGCWAVLIVAVWLSPHASGTGTHEELGLPACSFLAETGLPCPTCGMTTSVSAMAHGRIVMGWRAHPFGVVLFAVVAAVAVAATAEAVTGRNVLRHLRLGRLAWVLLLGIPGGWALKLAVGLADGSLPMR